MNSPHVFQQAAVVVLTSLVATTPGSKHSKHPKPAHRAAVSQGMGARSAKTKIKAKIKIAHKAAPDGPHGFASSPTQDEMRLLPAIHAAGLTGDHSQVPVIVASLGTLSDPFYYAEPLQALARLGATEALPAIDAVIQDNKNQDTTNYAVAARARLVAEAAVSGLPDGPVKAAVKIARFYQELGLTPAQLNQAEAQYQPQRTHRLPSGGPVPAPVGVAAVRQIADMVYHGNYGDYAALPGVAQVDFTPDYGAALKMRLAPLTQQQRISTMIQEMMGKKVYTMLDDMEGQLLANVGAAASQAIADQLMMMEANRSNYTDGDFSAMFGVLSDIGDTDQAPLVEHFEHDPDDSLAEHAKGAYYNVSQGVPVVSVIGY